MRLLDDLVSTTFANLQQQKELEMSGGYFDYNQYNIGRIADDVNDLIRNNEVTELDEWGDTRGRNYSLEVITKFREALTVLRQAEVYAQRIDWLVSGDDTEQSFLQRLEQDLSHIPVDIPESVV